MSDGMKENISSASPRTPEKAKSPDFLHQKRTRRGFLGDLLKTGLTAVVAPRIEILQTLTDTLKYLNQDREFLEQHPQNIVATADVLDQQGELNQQFILLDNKKLYKTYMDPKANALVPFQEVSNLSTLIENPRSIVTSSDGNTIIVGGEDPIRSGNPKLLISYNGGKDWTNIPWPYGVSGATVALVRLTDNIYLGNNGNFEGGTGSLFTIEINSGSQTVDVTAAQFETVNASNINVGNAEDISVTGDPDPVTGRVKLASNGSSQLQKGILLYDMDPQTATGTVEHVTHVKIGSNPNYELGYLWGRGIYIDSQGHRHYKASDRILQELYDIDLDTSTKTTTKLNYANILDSEGQNIPGYANGSLKVFTVDVITDAQGNINTWLGGTYAGDDGTGRAILIHLETLSYYLIEPDKDSQIIDQKNMHSKKLKGKSAYDLAVRYLGKAMLEINADGSPIPNAKPFYPNQGLAGILQLKNRVFVPIVYNNYSDASW